MELAFLKATGVLKPSYQSGQEYRSIPSRNSSKSLMPAFSPLLRSVHLLA